MKLEDLGVLNLKIYQDDGLYKFTSDAVLLSRFAKVKKGDVVADFCSGSGIVGLHLYGLNSQLIKSVTLFEMQKPLYELSLKSVEYNGLTDKFSAVNVKLQDISKEYCGKFSLIVCNPPYMDKNAGACDKNYNVAVCKTEIELSLKELLFALSNNVKYGGRVCLVHRADRLCDVLCGMRDFNLEPKRLTLVSAKNKAPYLFMVEGVKGGKSGIKITKILENV